MTQQSREFQNILAGVDKLFNRYGVSSDVLMQLCEDSVLSNQALMDATSGVIPDRSADELKLKILAAENVATFLRCLEGYRESLGFSGENW